MKRSLLFFVLVVFGIGSAAFAQAPASADKKTVISLDMASASREDLLRPLAKDAGFVGIVFDDPVPGTWSGQITDMTPAQAIRQLLPEGYEAVPDMDRVIHVRKVRTTAAADGRMTDLMDRRQAPPMYGYVPACDLPNMYTVPSRYNPGLGMTEADWILARNRVPCSRSYPTSIQNVGIPYGGNYQSGYVGYGQYGYGGPKTFEAWDEETAKKIRDQRHSAIVKFDGDSKRLERTRVEYRIDGKWLTPNRPVGASHWYQKPYIVSINDEGEIELRYTDLITGQSVTRNVPLISMAQARSNGKRDYINKIPVE